MRILFFVAQFPCTSETFVLNQVTSMIDKGHDVRVYSWGHADHGCTHEDIPRYNLASKTFYRDIVIPKSHVIRFFKLIPIIFRLCLKYGSSVFRLSSPRYGHPVNSKNLVQYYIAQRFLYMYWQPDVIISHFGDNGIIMTALRNAGIISPEIKCFTYFHAHEICRKTVSEIAHFYGPMFNNSDMLLPINNIWKERLIEAGAKPKNVKVLRMGVDIDRFGYIKHNNIGDTVNILSVGRLCGQKGFEYAILGVVEYAKSTKKTISYKIIGKGELDYKLKELVNKLSASGYIHFLGAQSQEVVAEEMEKANIFLLPSVTDEKGYMEGIPVALMEAMARGLVCISTYHSGIPEMIADNVNGLLCPEKDSESIADALMTIESLSINQFNTLREKARYTVEHDFNVTTETKKLQYLMDDTM